MIKEIIENLNKENGTEKTIVIKFKDTFNNKIKDIRDIRKKFHIPNYITDGLIINALENAFYDLFDYFKENELDEGDIALPNEIISTYNKLIFNNWITYSLDDQRNSTVEEIEETINLIKNIIIEYININNIYHNKELSIDLSI